MSDVNNTLSSSLWSTLNRRSGLALLFASAVAVGSLMAPHASFAEDKKAIKVGIISGEDEDVWRVVVAQAAEKGLTIETVVFNDYTQPNEALERGEIDANAFQHQPYLDNQIKTQGYHIVRVGYTGVWPIGLYSKKYTKVADLPEGAVIGVPNDPPMKAGAARAAERGRDQAQGRHRHSRHHRRHRGKPQEGRDQGIDAGIVGRSVEDLDAAVVNTDWALKSGLTPDNRIAQEPIADNPYRNFIAVKVGNENAAWVKTLVASYQNDAVKAEFDKVYKGTGLSAY